MKATAYFTIAGQTVSQTVSIRVPGEFSQPRDAAEDFEVIKEEEGQTVSWKTHSERTENSLRGIEPWTPKQLKSLRALVGQPILISKLPQWLRKALGLGSVSSIPKHLLGWYEIKAIEPDGSIRMFRFNK